MGARAPRGSWVGRGACVSKVGILPESHRNSLLKGRSSRVRSVALQVVNWAV